MLIVFDDMIAGMKSNKELSPIVIELLLKGRKYNILLAFISKSLVKVPKTKKLNGTYFIMKLLNNREIQQIALNHLTDTDFKDFIKHYRDQNKELFSFVLKVTSLGKSYYKKRVSQKIKTIINKIERNKAQYYLN